LLTLLSIIFNLILIIIGVSLFAYWLYVGVRSKEEHRIFSDYDTYSSSTNSGIKEGERICTCSICKHEKSNACMELRCPCCILTRNKQIIGYFNNPLQQWLRTLAPGAVQERIGRPTRLCCCH
jgi:hypothetical protein